MKKILLITEVFPPAFNPRMGYLVKYLSEFGWDADIITHNTLKDNNFKLLVGNNRIVRVNLKHTGIPHGYLQKFWYLVTMKGHFFNDRKPFIREMELNFRKDDYSSILVSVSWDLFVLDASFVISKKWDIPLIVDLRDIIEQKPNLVNIAGKNLKALFINCLKKSVENKKIQLRNKILGYVKAITTVSPFHVEQLAKFNNNVTLIYNGYDPDLFHPKYREKTSIFSIIYTGLIFKDEQDPTLLFEAVNQLENEKIINNGSFRIQFYTPVNYRSAILNHELYSMVEKYIDFFDYVDYRQVPELLQRSSIALVLTNISNAKGPKGVLTTKFFEYLGAERPVLCVRSDEGILENTIIRANIGVSARTARDAFDFILEKWVEWKEIGYTTIKVNQEYKRQFSRKAQAKQFTELFEKISTGSKS